MKIVNVMISRTLGGIEQMFLHYNTALRLHEHTVLSVVDNRCAVTDKINGDFLQIHFNKFNLLLVLQLYFKLRKFAPDVIIVHNKKAIPLFFLVAKLLHAKIVGVAHNPKVKRLEKCDAVFSIAVHQKAKLMANGLPEDKIFVVPNMIELNNPIPEYTQFHSPIVIGTMGRFDPMKGFGYFIDSLAILKQKQIPFKAIIGGRNNSTYAEEEKRIFQKVQDYGLSDEVQFCGWVTDKQKFFAQIDIFVIPSVFEPFGIVILEAAAAHKPIISSTAEGPQEVLTGTGAALMFENRNAAMLAEKIQEFISNPELARQTADNAVRLLQEKYTLQSASYILENSLQKVMEKK